MLVLMLQSKYVNRQFSISTDLQNITVNHFRLKGQFWAWKDPIGKVGRIRSRKNVGGITMGQAGGNL